MSMSMSTNILEMEVRQQNMEKEMSLLKDTVWKLTGRVFVLEAFLSEKFDELIVDFGMKLCLGYGGQTNFLNHAMQASFYSSTKSQQLGGNSSNRNLSSPSVGNITISHRSVDESDKNHHHLAAGGPVTLTRLTGPMAASGLSRVGQQDTTTGSSRDGNRTQLPNSRVLCKSETSGRGGESYQSQSDFNVEEFVVFPQVPEFVLGTELQNGSGGNLLTGGGSESSTEELEEEVEVVRRSSGSTGHKRNRQYKCVPCSKFFTSEWHLKAHLVKHSDGVLTISGQHQQQQGPGSVLTSSAQGAVPHGSGSMESEGNEDSSPGDSSHHKPFPCVYCAKRFKKRQELTVHLRIHTGEKPYKCPMCDRGFSQSSSMKTHLRIHTGEKKVKCEYCKSSFTVIHNYKKHLRTAHQIEEYA